MWGYVGLFVCFDLGLEVAAGRGGEFGFLLGEFEGGPALRAFMFIII